VSNERAAAVPNRWELRACGRHGHATYRPDEPELADRLHTETALGEAWRCLRCGNFVLGVPDGSGPADSAPLVLRGKALRQVTILRLLAVERALRAVILAVAVWAVLKFRDAQDSIQAAVDRDLPAFRAVGIHVDQLALVRDLQKALDQAPGRLTLIAVLLAAYAAVELVEGIGLWLLKRWGEYFAVVATAIFLPLEVRELLRGVTPTRAGAFIINVAAVVYLLVSKRLFGLRGGRGAYDSERRGEQLLEVEQSAAGASNRRGSATVTTVQSAPDPPDQTTPSPSGLPSNRRV
jgi:uncharacterized membrane protein (DUF2068 family)